MFSFIETTRDIEYWEESDTELDEDFPSQRPETPPDANEDTELLDAEQNAIVYWVTVFTCVLGDLLLSCTFSFPSCYRKMYSISVGNQQIQSKQSILAKSVFPFDTVTDPSIFDQSNVRVALVDHFAVHSFLTSDLSEISHAFVVVKWLLSHPVRHVLGKPYELWCKSLYDMSGNNFVTPIENRKCLLLTGDYVYEEETLILSVPLVEDIIPTCQ